MVNLAYSVVLGVVAGLLPVYIGLVPLWLLRRLSPRSRTILVSFSLGILVFLFVEVTGEALDLAKVPGANAYLFVIGIVLGLLAPSAISHRRRPRAVEDPVIGGTASMRSVSLFTAYMISMGIGLHNFGEGLAMGAAYGAGQIALTIILVLGFALHNGTEGLAIAGPMSTSRIGIKEPLIMGFLAGAPTVVGSLLGSYLFSESIGAIFFAVAAGALLYVIFELVKVTQNGKSGTAILGTVLGIVLMYVTVLLLGAP